MNTDGNLAALAAYEREQDRLQQTDDLLEQTIEEIWDSEDLLLMAINDAPSVDMPISDAIEHAARRMIREKRQ